MGLTLAQKLIKAHLVEGEMIVLKNKFRVFLLQSECSGDRLHFQSLFVKCCDLCKPSFCVYYALND